MPFPGDPLIGYKRPRQTDLIGPSATSLMRNSESQEPSKPIDIAQKLSRLSLESQGEQPPASLGSLSRDVELFLKASELERSGLVSQALKYYEQAFRLNPDVDRILSDSQEAFQNQPATNTTARSERVKFQPVVPGLLDQVCRAACESQKSTLLGLSGDIWGRVLSWVGYYHVVSLEECAQTCRTLYVTSRQDPIWHRLIRSALATRNNQVPGRLADLSSSPREAFFKLPRLRTDGLYICKISYLRPGVADGAFFQPVHMVTYFRYLRLLGEEYGHLATLLVTTEEPQRIIPLLQRPLEDHLYHAISFGRAAQDLVMGRLSQGRRRWLPTAKLPMFRKANLFLGRYFRDDCDERRFHLTLYDPQSTHNSLFSMEIAIPEDRKNSNILACQRYSSVTPPPSDSTQQTDCQMMGGPFVHPVLPSVYDFDISDWGRFVFSRVRSYHT